MLQQTLTPRERKIARRMEGRGQDGMAEALCQLKGVVFGKKRFRIDSLYAIGGEGAVYLASDLKGKSGPMVAKIPLHPLHRPFELNDDDIKARRESLRIEANFLSVNASPFMPNPLGIYEFQNPALDAGRGDSFAEIEPVVVMEKYPGRDLDIWLARTHRSEIPKDMMRRTLDRVAVVLLQGLVDLNDRGIYYADMRPGNLRMMGRPKRRIRFLDAGSLVNMDDKSGRFPHVPAYLPPDIFHSHGPGNPIIASGEIQAIMAGRTLYESATGRVPLPGHDVDYSLLEESNVSPAVAELVALLCRGEMSDVRDGLRHLSTKATRRVQGANDPSKVKQQAGPGADTIRRMAAEDSIRRLASEVVDGPRAAAPPMTPGVAAIARSRPQVAPKSDEILPPSTAKTPWWKRLLGLLFGGGGG